MPNEPLILWPSRRRTAGLVAIGIAFVTIGIFLVRDGQFWVGLLEIVFFGACTAVGLVHLLPGASQLRIDETGFTIRNLFREHSFRWADIDSFFVVAVPNGFTSYKMVGWNFVAGYEISSRVLGRLNQSIAGCDAAMPDTYGMKPAALADLLNERLTGPHRDPLIGPIDPQ